MAVVSTVLPGTCARLLAPLIRSPLRLAYTPSFIAMGTTVPDFLDPEFVLVGADDPEAYKDLERVWAPLAVRPHPEGAIGGEVAPVVHTSVVSAETIKVTYNTFIGLKIVFANAIMEVCQDIGADVDDVTSTLSLAGRRLLSGAYLQGGMGDGGGCHPRDQLAMAYLAQRLNLSFDLFTAVMVARDAQTEWVAAQVAHWADLADLPVVILGKAYKAGTNLAAGSPAALLVHYLTVAGHPPADWWDPHVDDRGWVQAPPKPAVFVVATRHSEFAELQFPRGSVVVDPWRMLGDQDGVTVVRLGRR